MTIAEIKEQLKRKAVVFNTGGKHPTNELLESWIGNVKWKSPEEDLPVDMDGKGMLPIATVFLKGLPYRPEHLHKVELITIFMSGKFWNKLIADDLSQWFCIRTYKTLDGLVPCEHKPIMKPFPLTPQLVENEYPMWDGGGIPLRIGEMINKMEEEDGIDYYEDIFEDNNSQHKIGGYPAFCQAGAWYGEDYPFVMQISSDVKAGFNIVHDGSFYFYYNSMKDDWKVHCDFY